MKKAIVFLLSLIILLSLVACGGHTTGNNSNANGQQDTSVSSEQDVGDDHSQETGSNDKTYSNGYENLADSHIAALDKIPKPQNTEITDSGEDYVTYTLRNATSKDVLDYEDILREEGMYVHLTYYSYNNYESEAEYVPAEIKIRFHYTGKEYISTDSEFRKRAKNGMEDRGDLSVTIRMRDLGSYNLPLLPNGDWCTDDDSNYVIHTLNSFVSCGKEERKSLAKDYVELLKSNGYTLEAMEYSDGKDGTYKVGYESLYYFSAMDQTGNCVTVSVGTEELDPYMLYDTDDWAEIEITLKKVEKK